MAKEDQIDRKINAAIDQICTKFDNKFKEQNNQINAQRKEIAGLKQVNAYYVDNQLQWTRVVNELEKIKITMKDAFGSLRRPDSTSTTSAVKNAVVPLTNSQSMSQQGQLRQLDTPETSDRKFLLDSGASTHVCGDINRFITRQQLDTPKVIALAVADCTIGVVAILQSPSNNQ
ncbi:hypothetical protein MJO28_003483 [Puccinia striiformis f. sp. tritici]|uniref:Uncharacterized protein n=1 Tax=Puccinia striiformis f. sp. tritici TaxID=168172 RepID=A0ACC0EV30_9BASI|nr:hypothetical protein MJO28_003483 [Puccinia striiformis f. sp. tritici]